MNPNERLYIARLQTEGLVQCSNREKQEMGREMARHIGFVPGPPGPDGGIDGVIPLADGYIAHFSSKLSSSNLDVYEAKLQFADVLWHHAAISVLVAGVGYKDTFDTWLSHAPHLSGIRFHFLTLADVLARIDWSRFR